MRMWLGGVLFAVGLLGFVLLLQPRAPQSLNWENLDLLKTVGMQAAGYLALNQAAEALAERLARAMAYRLSRRRRARCPFQTTAGVNSIWVGTPNPRLPIPKEAISPSSQSRVDCLGRSLFRRSTLESTDAIHRLSDRSR